MKKRIFHFLVVKSFLKQVIFSELAGSDVISLEEVIIRINAWDFRVDNPVKELEVTKENYRARHETVFGLHHPHHAPEFVTNLVNLVLNVLKF